MVLFFLVLGMMQTPPAVKAPEQPVPYSHRQHLALNLDCKLCHTNPDPGEAMGLPGVATCMNCHRSVKTDSPHIQKLAKWAGSGGEPPWVRVYELPSYVFFSHREHARAGAKCETCHGPVRTRNVLFKESDISMGGCMDCHRRHKASNDCTYCHEAR
jgi:hypothetical protein